MRLPRDSDYFLQRLADLHERMRDRLYAVVAESAVHDLAAVGADRGGDTIFHLDERGDEIMDEFFSSWGEELPLLLIAEGNPGDGGKTYPEGTPRNQVVFTCIVDPIDGTRGLMYGKRSAWLLSGIAPAPEAGTLPTLDTIEIAMQTELPTARAYLSDRLWAVQGGGVRGETHNLHRDDVRSFEPRPSAAHSLMYGFATVTKFFPGTKALAVEVEERLFGELLGSASNGNPHVFDDEYISSGGQLYELMMGHDRFIADLRPLLSALSGAYGEKPRLCAHPYDLCTELIAREAGVIVTDESGHPLDSVLDIRTDCGWLGYANEHLHAQIEPVLHRILDQIHREHGLA